MSKLRQSYSLKPRFKALFESDPGLAHDLERLILGAMAARGILMVKEPEFQVIDYITQGLHPFVQFTDTRSEAAVHKAGVRNFKRGRHAKRLVSVLPQGVETPGGFLQRGEEDTPPTDSDV